MNGPRDTREGGAGSPTGGKPGRARLFGVALLLFAALMWAPAVLLLPLSGSPTASATPALLVTGEVAFWASAVLLGREVFRRYRERMAPRRPFGGWG